MYCHNCGKQVEEGSSFCSNCGANVNALTTQTAPTVQAAVTQPVQEAVAQPAQAPVIPSKSKDPSKKWKVMIGVLSVLLVAAVGLIAYLLVTKNDGNSNENLDNPIIVDSDANLEANATTAENDADKETTEKNTTKETTSKEETTEESTTEETTTEETTTEESTTEGTTGDDKTVSLKVWLEPEMISSGWIEEMEALFEEKYPEWKVECEYVSCSSNDFNVKIARCDESDKPDIFCYNPSYLAKLIKADQITELNAELQEIVRLHNAQVLLDFVTSGSNIYGVPYTANTWMMYYDTSVYTEEEIKSLDAMMEVAPVGMMLDNGWYISSFFSANGCTFDINGFDIPQEKAEEVVSYLMDKVSNKKLISTQSEGLEKLEKGEISAYMTGVWDEERIRSILGDNFGVVELPKVNLTSGDGQLRAMCTTSAIGVSDKCKDNEVVTAFVEFITDASRQGELYRRTGKIPCHDNFLDMWEDEATSATQKVLQYTSIPQSENLGAWWTPASELAVNIADGSITDVKELVDKFLKSIEEYN